MNFYKWIIIFCLYTPAAFSSECYLMIESTTSQGSAVEFKIIYKRIPCEVGALTGEAIVNLNHRFAYTLSDDQYGVSVTSNGISDWSVENATDVGQMDLAKTIIIAHSRTNLIFNFSPQIPLDKSQPIIMKLVISPELYFR